MFARIRRPTPCQNRATHHGGRPGRRLGFGSSHAPARLMPTHASPVRVMRKDMGWERRSDAIMKASCCLPAECRRHRSCQHRARTNAFAASRPCRGRREPDQPAPPVYRLLFDPGRRPRVECAGRLPSRRTPAGTARRGRQGWRKPPRSGARRASLTAPSTVASHLAERVFHSRKEDYRRKVFSFKILRTPKSPTTARNRSEAGLF